MQTQNLTPPFIDPVCGMTVEPASAASKSEHGGVTYYFCSPRCLQRLEADPAGVLSKAPGTGGADCCGSPPPASVKLEFRPRSSPRQELPKEEAPHSCCGHDGGKPKVVPSAKAAYFCPMCPGVESDKPGTCPKCGMALEPAGPPQASTRVIYTCPMHAEIERDEPGACPDH
jgi:Cu+-exporting ATPase